MSSDIDNMVKQASDLSKSGKENLVEIWERRLARLNGQLEEFRKQGKSESADFTREQARVYEKVIERLKENG